MAEIKTKPTTEDVNRFLNKATPEDKKKEALELHKIFTSATKEKATVWNNGMIGYGTYHYKSERSTQEGYWPLTAFSIRKQHLTLYIMSRANNHKELMSKLGKIKASSSPSCLHIAKLENIDLKILKKLIEASVKDMKKRYPKNK